MRDGSGGRANASHWCHGTWTAPAGCGHVEESTHVSSGACSRPSQSSWSHNAADPRLPGRSFWMLAAEPSRGGGVGERARCLVTKGHRGQMGAVLGGSDLPTNLPRAPALELPSRPPRTSSSRLLPSLCKAKPLQSPVRAPCKGLAGGWQLLPRSPPCLSSSLWPAKVSPAGCQGHVHPIWVGGCSQGPSASPGAGPAQPGLEFRACIEGLPMFPSIPGSEGDHRGLS